MLVLLYSKLIWAAFGRPFSFLVGAFDDGASAFFIVEVCMAPHQQRVVDEKDQLADRLNKLNDFLSKGQPSFIDDAEWTRLTDQHMHMNEYHEILIDRINHFVSA